MKKWHWQMAGMPGRWLVMLSRGGRIESTVLVSDGSPARRRIAWALKVLRGKLA